MLEFQVNEDKSLSTGTKDWSFHMDSPDRNLFELNFGKGLRARSTGMEVEGLSEALALPQRRRPHVHQNGAELSLDAPCAIPFGSEPAIARKFHFEDGFMSATVDLTVRPSAGMKKISAGGLSFSGVQAACVTSAPENGCTVEPAQPRALTELPETIYDAAVPPLMVSVCGSDGTVVNFRTGEDLWRWTNAERLDGKCRFQVKKSADSGLELVWNLYEFAPKTKDQEPPAGRNWRLTWSLDWKSGKKQTEKTAEYLAEFDLTGHEWNSDALCRNAAGEILQGHPCATSSAVINELKRWLRTYLRTAQEGDVLAVRHAASVYCCAAAHMERPKQNCLAHWDYASMQEFRRWGNRQLAASGAKLVLLED